jgi:hypothetical protein
VTSLSFQRNWAFPAGKNSPHTSRIQKGNHNNSNNNNNNISLDNDDNNKIYKNNNKNNDRFDFPTKFAAFTAIFAFEKVLLIGEFIPFGVILPTISPALFGSVLAGTLVTATSSTLASSVNFWLGRSFLRQRVRAFALPGQPPIGESRWFQAIFFSYSFLYSLFSFD